VKILKHNPALDKRKENLVAFFYMFYLIWRGEFQCIEEDQRRESMVKIQTPK
jgi:hypothetical protein